jgi:uncharacterized protein YeeX (DUF496 family)
MKVFITWSGASSKDTAVFLSTWLRGVLQELRPWVSAVNIGAGARWSVEVQAALRDSTFGIACVTQDNQSAPWLLFETGAIAKGLDSSRVCCYCLGMDKRAITVQCLNEFQNVNADEPGTYEMLVSLNDMVAKAAPGKELTEGLLQQQFKVNWPSLRDHIAQQTFRASETITPAVSTDEAVREVLETVRKIAREMKRVQYYGSLHNYVAPEASAEQVPVVDEDSPLLHRLLVDDYMLHNWSEYTNPMGKRFLRNKALSNILIKAAERECQKMRKDDDDSDKDAVPPES